VGVDVTPAEELADLRERVARLEQIVEWFNVGGVLPEPTQNRKAA
jgi:hypothetical protein